MRKLIVLLLLSFGVKGQEMKIYSPIWTYTGSNIQYTNGSVIAGSLTTAGTLSVGSTATVGGALNVGGGTNGFIAGNVSGTNRLYTSGNQFYFVNSGNGDAGLSAGTATFGGAITANTLQGSGQTRIYSGTNTDLILRATGASNQIQCEINGSPKLNITSNGASLTGSLITTGTHSLGSANLTGGNTGTVAVLSDALFSLNFQALSSNPADATNYTISTIPFGLTGFDLGGVSIPYNSTIVGWTFNSFTNGAVGTTETSTLQITLNGTATTLTTGIVSNTVVSTYSASGLNISVSAGDILKEVFKTPTWSTNPTSFATSLIIFLVRRS